MLRHVIKTRLLTVLLLIGTMLLLTTQVLAADAADASIDWKQFSGERITVGVVDFGNTQVLRDMIPAFETLTGIQVDYQMYPEPEWNQKSVVELSSRAGTFDVLLVDFMLVPQYAATGFIEPLDPYLQDKALTDKSWYDFEDISPSLRDASSWDGTVWGVPLMSETTLLFYRTDIFEQLGLEPPRTMDELWAAAMAIRKEGNTAGIAMRGLRGQGLNIYVWTSFLRAFGGKFFEDYPNNMTPVVNSPEAVKATEFYADILRQAGPPGVASWDWAEVLAAMEQGETAMAIDASDFGFQIDDAARSRTAGEWGYTLIPAGSHGVHPSVFSFLLTMNAASRNKGPAWLFMQWVTSKSTSLRMAIETGIPIRNSTWEDSDFQQTVSHIGGGQWVEATTEALDIASADFRPRFEYWREVGDRLGVAVQAAIAGEPAQTALDEAQRDIERILRRTGLID